MPSTQGTPSGRMGAGNEQTIEQLLIPWADACPLRDLADFANGEVRIVFHQGQVVAIEPTARYRYKVEPASK